MNKATDLLNLSNLQQGSSSLKTSTVSQAHPYPSWNAYSPFSEEHAGALIEFALVSVLFLSITMLGIDLIRATYVTVAGRYALQKTARWSLLGESLERDLNDGTGPQRLNRVASIKRRLLEDAGPLGLRVDSTDISICPASQPDCDPDNPASAGQMFIIRWEYPLQLLIWPIQYHFNFEAFGRNED